MDAPAKTGDTKKPFVRRERREDEWVPLTSLGKLVKKGKITSLETIFRSSLTIRESQIIDHLCGSSLREEILSVKSVQKQTSAGQKTRIKVVAVVGDGQGHVGVGCKSAKEAASAIRAAVARAKCNIRPVRMGLWEGVEGEAHTVSCRGSGKCGSVRVTVIPAPRGTGVVANKICKKIFDFAGIRDVFTKSYGSTCTSENLAKAAVDALEQQSCVFIPSQWVGEPKTLNPLLEFADILNSFEKTKI